MVGSSKHYGPEPVVLLFIFHIVFVFEAVQTECFNSHHYKDRGVPVLVLKAYGEWRYSSTKFNLTFSWG